MLGEAYLKPRPEEPASVEVPPVYVCICHGVHEREVRGCIKAGARTEDAVGDACQAGTGCGTCLDRIADLLEAEYGAPATAASLAKPDLF